MRASWIVAVICAVPLGAALEAQQTVRVRGDTVEVRRAFVRDTARMRTLTSANTSEVMRVVNELRAREEAIMRQIEGLPASRITERRQLEEELARVSREAFTVMSVIESRCLEERNLPPGYLGLSLTAEMNVRDRDVSVERTVVSSVEPGSPAERAGLESGDLLVSIAGRDARRGVPELADLLEPGRRVAVLVERAGRPVGFDVTVAPRPRGYGGGCNQLERAMMPLRMGGMARVWVQDSTDGEGNRVVYVVTPATPPTPPAPPARPSRVSGATPTPPAPPAAPSVFTFVTPSNSNGVGYFAGAQFRQLDEDWRGVLGVKPGTVGVLVNEVAPGSDAAQAGLRVGDVITHVDAAAATSPLVVVRLLGLADGPVTLKVTRGRENRLVTMRGELRRRP